MTRQVQFAETLTFCCGSVALYLTFPQLMIWSIRASRWLSVMLFERGLGIDGELPVKLQVLLAVVCFFGILFAATQLMSITILWCVRAGTGRGVNAERRKKV